MKARPLIKTSVLRSRRVNLFKNHVHFIERPRRIFTHCYIIAFESQGTQTAFNTIRPTACASSSIKTFAFLIIAFVLSNIRRYTAIPPVHVIDVLLITVLYQEVDCTVVVACCVWQLQMVACTLKGKRVDMDIAC